MKGKNGNRLKMKREKCDRDETGKKLKMLDIFIKRCKNRMQNECTTEMKINRFILSFFIQHLPQMQFLCVWTFSLSLSLFFTRWFQTTSHWLFNAHISRWCAHFFSRGFVLLVECINLPTLSLFSFTSLRCKNIEQIHTKANTKYNESKKKKRKKIEQCKCLAQENCMYRVFVVVVKCSMCKLHVYCCVPVLRLVSAMESKKKEKKTTTTNNRCHG